MDKSVYESIMAGLNEALGDSMSTSTKQNLDAEHRFVMSNFEYIIKSFIKNPNCVVMCQAMYSLYNITFR